MYRRGWKAGRREEEKGGKEGGGEKVVKEAEKRGPLPKEREGREMGKEREKQEGKGHQGTSDSCPSRPE